MRSRIEKLPFTHGALKATGWLALAVGAFSCGNGGGTVPAPPVAAKSALVGGVCGAGQYWNGQTCGTGGVRQFYSTCVAQGGQLVSLPTGSLPAGMPTPVVPTPGPSFIPNPTATASSACQRVFQFAGIRLPMVPGSRVHRLPEDNPQSPTAWLPGIPLMMGNGSTSGFGLGAGLGGALPVNGAYPGAYPTRYPGPYSNGAAYPYGATNPYGAPYSYGTNYPGYAPVPIPPGTPGYNPALPGQVPGQLNGFQIRRGDLLTMSRVKGGWRSSTMSAIDRWSEPGTTKCEIEVDATGAPLDVDGKLGGIYKRHRMGFVASDGTRLYDLESGRARYIFHDGVLRFGFNIPTWTNATCEKLELQPFTITRCTDITGANYLCPTGT